VPLFSKVLVANRGEIAIRIFRTLRELGIASVAVYSEADRSALHVRAADEAWLVGPPAPKAPSAKGRSTPVPPASIAARSATAESYLNQTRLLEAAERAGAEAVHPGYGFLAENAEFAQAVEDSGLVWIGPPPAAIEAMGSKTDARKRMRAAGVPIIPGTTAPVTSAAEVARLGEELGWPIAIKAAAGGGGKGFKVVRGVDEAERAFESASREGETYFADPTVYVERYLEDPRHVEVQLLADAHGNVIHLGERDCTIQRRHQKLVEETPSPAVDAELRERIGAIAVEAARAVGYRSAGTVEGLLAADGAYYFMEMNTRIQVEHTVTELVTGLDLVREQVLIAAGEPLSLRQEDVRLTGHAIECRINAENPSNGFLPTPGRIAGYREPGGPGVRVDSGVADGSEVTALYDPMIAKLVVHGVDREHARRRMLRALDEFEIGGVTTLLGFHRALLRHPCFVDAATCHGVVESEQLAQQADQLSHRTTVAPPPDGRVRERVRAVELDGRRFEARILEPAPPWVELAERRRQRAAGHHAGGARDAVVSPMQGTVLSVQVAEGDSVSVGQVICIVEAMKMENEVHAVRDGVVSELSVAVGEPVRTGQVICVLAPEADGS
jgi:acetyl-CoA/propionyl-CoA carboxylase biotin carboxyl carrier protein